MKPYHEILGVTFQYCTEPKNSLRIIFQMPSDKKKKCVVKITSIPLKSITTYGSSLFHIPINWFT